LITFAPAFRAKFIQELWAVEDRVKRRKEERGRKEGLIINCDKIPKKVLV